MYKHILLPVDGSEFGMGVIPYAIKFAKAIGAKLSALTVSVPYSAIAPGAVAGQVPEEAFAEATLKAATNILEKARAAAAAEGIALTAYHAHNIHPWEAIINTAKEHECDLIIMASHGRRGIAGVLLGSETKRVLTHTNIPVLVWRGA